MGATKDRILAHGVDLLSRDGLAGVTLGALAERTGMSKSGLFAHFESKEDVQLQLLAEAVRLARLTFVDAAMARPAGLARLRALFEGWLNWSEKAGLSGGCPATAALFELDDAGVDDPVRKRLVEMEQARRTFLGDVVRDAVTRGDLRADVDAEQFAWELSGIFLVYHTSHRLLRDPDATRRATTAFDSLVTRSSGRTPDCK